MLPQIYYLLVQLVHHLLPRLHSQHRVVTVHYFIHSPSRLVLQNEIHREMPFQNRAIMQGITSMFFRGARSYIVRNQNLFKMTVNGAKVRLIPPLMIALVATAVSPHHSILFSLITLVTG